MPNFVVVSDFDEVVDGVEVTNVLGGVSENIKKEHEDFKLYQHLQEHGRKGLPNQQPITAMSGSSKGDYLQTANPSWSLDKWKFLPMVDHAYKKKTDAKWYIFIETDTYLAWSNLLAYLTHFDATKPLYIGKHLYINALEFAYGGAGIILSNPAAHAVHTQHSTHKSSYESFTSSHWVGDCALGKVLEDTHIPLHRAFPHLQSDSPSTLDPATTKIDRDLWCFPAITYHHVSPAEIAALWAFEQEWYERHAIALRHRDVFMEFIRPQIDAEVGAWDNLSDGKEFNAHDYRGSESVVERDAWKSFGHCRALCEGWGECVQFSFDVGSCVVSTAFRLGYARPGGRVRSGWMLERVDDLFRGLEGRCGVRDWFAEEEKGGRELRMRRKRSV